VGQHIGKDYKDPDDTKKFTVNWAPYLRTGATLSSVSTPTPPAGITVSATTNDTTTSTHTISGGRVGQDYVVTARGVTSDGEQLDLEFTVAVI
jgi:hypothetical protein